MPKKPAATGTRKVPVLRTDEEAEAFLMQDLSDLDFSQFKRMHFEFEKKETQVNLRVPDRLLDAVKDRAKAQGIPYTRYIRLLMERDIAAK
jgi:predicted DNA binding CopG/RHH family protein